MKDSIHNNLDFKLVIFITLLGSWFWLLKYYLSFIPLNGKELWPWFIMVISYIIFYPMFKLAMMLIYASLYQVNKGDNKDKELINEYSKNAKAFYEWWPVAIIIGPVFLFIAFFPGRLKYLAMAISILYVVWIKIFCFKKIYTFKDIGRYFRGFYRPFLIYFLIFVAIILITKFYS